MKRYLSLFGIVLGLVLSLVLPGGGITAARAETTLLVYTAIEP